MQSSQAISGEANDDFAQQATQAMLDGTADAHRYQDESAHFMHTHSDTAGRDVTAGQKGEAGGSGHMRGPEHLVKEAGSEG